MRKIILIFLAMPFAANADIIDLGPTTADTVAGLEWLDMNYTTGQMISTVLNNMDNYVGGGWRYASNAEVDGFVAEVTGQGHVGID